MRISRAVVAAAVLALFPQPGMAKDDFAAPASLERRSDAFLGLNLRLPLGRERAPVPEARVRFSLDHSLVDRRTGKQVDLRAQGMEFGFNGAGKPALYLGGRQIDETLRSFGLDGDRPDIGTFALVAGGAVAAATLLFVATNDKVDDPETVTFSGPDQVGDD